MVIATNTDIMFSARLLKSVEEAIIINVKRYSRFIKWHRLIDVIGRLFCPITLLVTSSCYRFHECSLHIYRILFFANTHAEWQDTRDHSSSLTCIPRHTNSADVLLSISLTANAVSHLFSVRSRRRLFLLRFLEISISIRNYNRMT